MEPKMLIDSTQSSFSAESSSLMNVYNFLRETCGISQAEAAEFHDARLDSIKSWCSDRRPAPAGVIREIRSLAKAIHEAGASYASVLKSLNDAKPFNKNVFEVGLPHDDRDARHCGFPSLSTTMRSLSVAILNLPDDAEIQMVPRVRGERPINLIPHVVDAAFSFRSAIKLRMRHVFDEGGDPGREERGRAVIDQFKINGGDAKQLFKFYRDEFDGPGYFGFDLLEKAASSAP
jgi:hypothetical protein